MLLGGLAVVAVGCAPPPTELDSGEAVVSWAESPFELRVDAGDWLTLQGSAPMVFVGQDGERVLTGDVAATSAVDDAVELQVQTSTGEPARVGLRWTSARSLRVSIEPPPGAFVALEDAWRLADGELIYGLTERLRDSEMIAPLLNGPMLEDIVPVEVGSLDRRGEIVEMFVHPTFSLYAPLHHSSRGYGLWVENTAPGSYDVGATDPDELRMRFETGTTDASRSLTYHLLLGPSHADILAGYYELTGYPIRPPDWTFLHWRWRDELEHDQPPVELDGLPVNAQVAEDVLMYEQHDIPFGVYLFDRPYLVGSSDSDSQGFAVLQWDEERLPNAAHMLEALRGRGMPVAVWAASWARGVEAGTNGADAAELGYLAPGSDRVIDFTNPDAVAWWQQRLGAFVQEWGIRGIKLDRGEEYIPNDPDDIWHDGRSGREVHNEFQTLQARVFHDLMDDATDGDFVVMARAGYSGSQRWATSWGGDAPGDSDLGLRGEIIKLQRSGFLGFSTWGSDTGGYEQFEDREVFARWLEFSAFCPIMEIGGRGAHAPWAMPTEPAFDEEMIEIYRRYVQLHHDLLPYTAAQADIASAAGTPIARAMVFDFPDDPAMLDRWDQYMYGPDLLVAPVWRSGARQRGVVLPAGEWEWLWDRELSWTGPQTVTVDAPLDVIPVFVRAGAEPGVQPDR